MLGLLVLHLLSGMGTDALDWSSHVQRSASLVTPGVLILRSTADQLRLIQTSIALVRVLGDGVGSRAPHVTTLALVGVHIEIRFKKKYFAK